MADDGAGLVADPQPQELRPPGPVGVFVIGEEGAGEGADPAQRGGGGDQRRPGGGEAVAGCVEGAAIGGLVAVVAAVALETQVGAGVVDEVDDVDGLHGSSLQQTAAVARRAGARRWAAARSSTASGGGPAARFRPDGGPVRASASRSAPSTVRLWRPAERPGVAVDPVGDVVEADLGVGTGEEQLRDTAATPSAGSSGPATPRSSSAGHGVVVEQGDDVALGDTETEVHAGGEPGCGEPDRLGPPPPTPPGSPGGRGAVVDDDHLVGLPEDRGQTAGQPVTGVMGDDHHRRRRSHAESGRGAGGLRRTWKAMWSEVVDFLSSPLRTTTVSAAWGRCRSSPIGSHPSS